MAESTALRRMRTDGSRQISVMYSCYRAVEYVLFYTTGTGYGSWIVRDGVHPHQVGHVSMRGRSRTARPATQLLSNFITEQSDVLDRVIPTADPLFVDLNIRVEHDDDSRTRQFVELRVVRAVLQRSQLSRYTRDDCVTVPSTSSSLETIFRSRWLA